MPKYTFTIYDEEDTVFGYMFDVTRAEAQGYVSEMNDNNDGNRFYYTEGYFEK